MSQTEIADARRRVTTPASIGLLLLRLGFAVLLFVHGLAGALHLDRFTDQVRSVDDPVPVRASVVAVVLVVVAVLLAVLIGVGFLTRVAGGLLLVLAGAVWYSVHHTSGSPFVLADLQQTVTGERVIALGLVGLALVFTGPGRLAVDHGSSRSRDGSGAGSQADRDPAPSTDTPDAGPKRAGGGRGAAKGKRRQLPDDPSAWTDEDFRNL